MLSFLYPRSVGIACLYFSMAVLLCYSLTDDVSLAENVVHVVLAGIIPELAETVLHKAPGVLFCCIIHWPQWQEYWPSSPLQVVMHVLWFCLAGKPVGHIKILSWQNKAWDVTRDLDNFWPLCARAFFSLKKQMEDKKMLYTSLQLFLNWSWFKYTEASFRTLFYWWVKC